MTSINMSFEELHVIDGMIYCHEIEKYVTVEEYCQECVCYNTNTITNG